MIFTRHTIPNALAAIGRALLRVFSRDPVMADAFVGEIRRARCQFCPANVEGQCVDCTCLIDLKTLVASEECPRGRWRRQTRFNPGI